MGVAVAGEPGQIARLMTESGFVLAVGELPPPPPQLSSSAAARKATIGVRTSDRRSQTIESKKMTAADRGVKGDARRFDFVNRINHAKRRKRA